MLRIVKGFLCDFVYFLSTF